MCLHGCFKGFVELIYVVDDLLDVAICGVLALYDFDISFSSVCGVNKRHPSEFFCVADCSYEVRSVVFWYVLWAEYVVWDGLGVIVMLMFFIL